MLPSLQALTDGYARKARLVCDHIRGKDVAEARAILAFTPRAAAKDWAKLLESAVANLVQLIAFVAAATTFSLATQAYILGAAASTIAAHVGIGRGVLILTLLPHALPELVGLFLPLAAWMIASRRGAWQDLLAATAATTAMAVPLLVLAANLEIFVWPHLLRLASPAV